MYRLHILIRLNRSLYTPFHIIYFLRLSSSNDLNIFLSSESAIMEIQLDLVFRKFSFRYVVSSSCKIIFSFIAMDEKKYSFKYLIRSVRKIRAKTLIICIDYSPRVELFIGRVAIFARLEIFIPLITGQKRGSFKRMARQIQIEFYAIRD